MFQEMENGEMQVEIKTQLNIETFQEWNNPGSWITYPKTAIPVWVNLFLFEKIPEHKILTQPDIQNVSNDEINLSS